MDDCQTLLLECLACMAAGVGVIACCWRLRRPLRWAQTYDGRITEEGLYDDLPIYGYLRRYMLVLLLGGLVVLLTSASSLVFKLPSIIKWDSCELDTPVEEVGPLLLIFFGIHMSTIAWFETVRRRHGPYRIKALVDDVGKRLWGVAVFLLVAGSLLFVL